MEEGPNRSHREAERRHRERASMPIFVPSVVSSQRVTPRDEASLLAEVVQGLKELSKQVDGMVGNDLAMSSSGCSDESMESCAIPGEFDEVNLSYHPGGNQGEDVVWVEASVCCNDRAGLNGELARVFQAFRARTIHAEMSTQDGRTRVGVVVECAIGDHKFGKLRWVRKATMVMNPIALNDGPGFMES